MVIDKICKMTVEGIKSKLESFFSISHVVLELWRKTLGGGGFRPSPRPDRVKYSHAKIGIDKMLTCYVHGHCSPETRNSNGRE